MLILIKFIGKIIAILNSEESPKQLGAGFALGAWIGLMPIAGLMPTLFTLGSFLINVNLGILAFAVIIFKALAYLVDPVANQLGFALLTKTPSLVPLWTKLYNLPVVPYTRFNNTIVLGSFVIGFILLVPNYFLGKWLVHTYRTRFRDKVQQFKIMKFFKASSIYQYYERYRQVRGD